MPQAVVTKTPALKTLALTTLTLDARLQPRLHKDEDLVCEYADAMRRGDTFPPIRVIADDERHWLVDGWHRVTAAKRAQRSELQAEVSTGTFDDAEDYVLTANRTHGLRRTQADVQNAIRRALLTKRWVERSDNWIGKHIGCSDKTVSTLRQQLESTSEIPKLKKLLGEDGKTRVRRPPKPAPAPTTTPKTPTMPVTTARQPERKPAAPINIPTTAPADAHAQVEAGGGMSSVAWTRMILEELPATCSNITNAVQAIEINTDADRVAILALLKDARARIAKLYDLLDDAHTAFTGKAKTA